MGQYYYYKHNYYYNASFLAAKILKQPKAFTWVAIVKKVNWTPTTLVVITIFVIAIIIMPQSLWFTTHPQASEI